MKLKLKARVSRSDARTIRRALEQLSAKGFVKKEGDEFLVCRERRSVRNGLLTTAPPKGSSTTPEEDSQELTRHRATARLVRMPFRKPILLGFGCREGSGRLGRFTGAGSLCDHRSGRVGEP